MAQATGYQAGSTDQGDGGAPARPASALHRLIAARDRARPAPEAAAAARPVSLERAAATALGRTAERQAQLPVFVEKVELGAMALPELSERLPERALLAVVEGPKEAIGVVAICPNLLAALIEMQTLGRVAPRPAAPRRPTRTDAVISAEFVNLLLGELSRETAGRPACPDFGSFRYATYMDDPRPLSLMLEDGGFARLDFRFRMGPGGQRDGQLLIVLPDPGQSLATPPLSGEARATSRPTPVQAPAQPPASAPAPAASLAEAVREAPIPLVGILCRRKLSLQTLRGLGPGSLIPLPQNVLDDARIETPLGQVLARGRLGEADGFHAIRLHAADQQPAPRTDEPRTAEGFTATPAPSARSGEPLPLDLEQPDPFRAAGKPVPAPKQNLAG